MEQQGGSANLTQAQYKQQDQLAVETQEGLTKLAITPASVDNRKQETHSSFQLIGLICDCCELTTRAL